MGLRVQGFRVCLMGCRSCAEVSLETFLRTLCGDLTLLGVYLEGQGHLLCRFIMGITMVTIWVIRVINLFTMSP